MKFTKRAYIKVWQNCPEDEREDTTITFYDYEDANELNSIPVAPPIPARVPCVRQQYGRIQHSRMLPYSRIVRPHRLRQNLPGHAQQNRRLLDTHEVHHRQPETRGRYPTRLLLPTMRSVDLAGHHTALHQRTTRKRRRILPTNPRNLQEQPRPAVLPQLRATLQIRRPRPTSIQAPKQPCRHPTHAQTQSGNATNVRLGGV